MHDMSNTRKEIAARLGFAAGFGRDYPSKVTETAGASGGTWSKKMARYGSKKAAVITYTDGGQVGQVYQDPDNPRVFKAFDMGGRLLGEGSEMDMKRKVEAITASRPGAKAEFAETEPMNQFKVGQVVKVKVATGVVEGTVVKRMYDSMTGGERYLVEMPSQSQRGKMEQTAVFPYQIRASRPGAKAKMGMEAKYSQAFRDAMQMMEKFEDLEPTSAFKQAASDLGIPEGEEMRKFVEWARKRIRASRPGAKTRMTREQTEEQKAGLKIMSAADPAVGAKIAKLIKEGKPQDQAVAIALDMKRRGEL